MARAEVNPTWSGRITGAKRRRRGTTLIEILVVIALLAIGIFAIIRLFPQGFASINATGSILTADTLAQKNEDYFRKLRENLPDGIVSVDTTGNIVTGLLPDDYLGTRPYGNLTMQDEDGNQIPVIDVRFSLGNLARRVIGEQVKVPPPTTVAIGGGSELASIYSVLCAPIYSAGQMLSGGALGVKVRSGTPMTRVVFQDPPTQENWQTLRQLGDFGYGINYETGKLYLAYFDVSAKSGNQAWDRRLIAEYRYHPDPNTTLYTPPGGQALPVATVGSDPGWDPANPNWAQPGWVFTLQPNIDPGSDLISRDFKLAGGAFASDPDPYQFKVYDPVTGLIGFKPELASLPLPQQEGRGLTVKIDYDVDDWQILRQDLVLPTEVIDPLNGASPYYSFKLSTGAIKEFGETEDTPSFDTAGNATLTYGGLVRNYPAAGGDPARTGTPGIDLVMVDLETGNWIASDSLQAGNVASNGEIDYRNGVIHLKPTAAWNPPPVGALGGTAQPMNPAGRHVRVFYRTYNDFAVTPLKNWGSYVPQTVAANLGSAPFRGQDFLPITGGFVMFPPASAEKQVAVDYSWSDSAGALHHETGEVHQVALPTDAGGPSGNSTYGWVHLSPGLDVLNNFNPNSVQITGVRGTSFQTLVTWREAKQWRRRLRSAVLTRDQGS